MPTIKKGTTTVVENKDRKFGADPEYVVAHLNGEYLLFTKEQIYDAAMRAEVNKSDMKKVKLKRCII